MPDREKVIEGLNGIHAVACGLGDDECCLNSIGIKQLQTLINDATELLRAQEPCEDAVSRDVVMDILNTKLVKRPLDFDTCAIRFTIRDVMADIEALPSVQPVPVARVMTADDFENNPEVDHDGFLPAWIEYRRNGDWGEYWGDQHDEWGVARADRIVYENMRYWTSRPTDAQRKAVKWDE